MIRTLSGLLLLGITLRAQAPIENTGTPMLIPYTCTAEDLDEAGLTCSNAQPCPVYLELNGAEVVLARIFLAGDIHTADATLYSILLASEDGGRTWTEAQPRTRFTALEQIQFFDFESGWIAGANVQGVPRDPFFLITGDGGKTLDPQGHLRREPDRGGGTLLVRFQNHWRTLDHHQIAHELYDSKTGGESWSMRQFSPTPLKLKKDRAPGSALLRLRADAKSHSYHVENGRVMPGYRSHLS